MEAFNLILDRYKNGKAKLVDVMMVMEGELVDMYRNGSSVKRIIVEIEAKAGIDIPMYDLDRNGKKRPSKEYQSVRKWLQRRVEKQPQPAKKTQKPTQKIAEKTDEEETIDPMAHLDNLIKQNQ